MSRKLMLLLACGALALAAGCGGGNEGDGGGQAPPAATQATEREGAGTDTAARTAEEAAGGEVEIKMRNIAFDPKDATVRVGQPVKWKNEDAVDHNAVATSGASFKSTDFGKGGTYEFTPEKAGTIKYTCTLHPGMDGTLKVTG